MAEQRHPSLISPAKIEMRAAARIQEAILPEKLPSLPNVQLAVLYAPMTAIAGDLYDFPTVGPNGISVLMADVLGHGVPAALIASMVKVAVSRRLSGIASRQV